jgi:hypothetical protein
VIHFDISGCERKIKELEESMNSQDFWNDIERSQKVNREIKNLRTKTDRYKKLVSEVEDIETLIDLAIEENDDSVTDEVKHSINILDKEINAFNIETSLSATLVIMKTPDPLNANIIHMKVSCFTDNFRCSLHSFYKVVIIMLVAYGNNVRLFTGKIITHVFVKRICNNRNTRIRQQFKTGMSKPGYPHIHILLF